MALHHNPRIVTSGLQLLLDPADPTCYPGTGTTIYDLSGNGNDGSLNDGTAATSGYFHFVDSADDISLATPLTIAREKLLAFGLKRIDRYLLLITLKQDFLIKVLQQVLCLV